MDAENRERSSPSGLAPGEAWALDHNDERTGGLGPSHQPVQERGLTITQHMHDPTSHPQGGPPSGVPPQTDGEASSRCADLKQSGLSRVT